MSIAPIVIEFLAKGTPNVSAAIRNVSDTLAKAERKAQSDAERGAKARERIANQEARAKLQSWLRTDREISKIQDKAIRETEKAAKAQERAIEQAARAKVRIEAQAAREVERIQERAHRKALASIQAEEREKSRAGARWVADQERAQRSAERARERLVGNVVGAAGRGVAAGAQRVAGIATGLANTTMQLGGGFSLGDSLMKEKNLRHQAAVLSASTILTRANGSAETGRAMSTDELVKKAKAIGIQQNIDPAEVLKGFDEVKKLSGNVEKATQVMPGIAKLATATGGNLGEMSGLAANIIAANPTISNEELNSQMRVFTRQGAVGGVEVADFAKYGSRLTAGASLFGGDKSANQATLGAIAQISRQYGGASTAAEASLASQRFATDVAGSAAALKKKGIEVSDGKGGLRDAKAILLDMIEKTGGDVTKLKTMGLGDRGVKALTGVSAIYKDAGGGDAGKEAVKREFAKYTEGVTKKEIDDANKRVLGEGGAKLDIAMQELRQTVGEQLLPEFVKLVPVIKESTPAFVTLLKEGVPAFVKLIKAVADFVNANQGLISDLAAHPIGTIMAFEVSKSIGAAGLGEVVKRAISAAIGGGGGVGRIPIPGGAAVAKTLATIPGGGSTVALGVASGVVAGNAELAYSAGTEDAQDLRAKVEAYQRGDHERGVSPAAAKAQVEAARARLANTGTFEQVGNIISSPFSDSSSNAYAKYKSDQALVDNEALAKQIAKGIETPQQALIDALNSNTAAVAARGDSSGPNGSGRAVPILER